MPALDAHTVTRSPKLPQLFRLSREHRTKTLHQLPNRILKRGLSPKGVTSEGQLIAPRLPKTEAGPRTNNKTVNREHAVNRKQNE